MENNEIALQNAADTHNLIKKNEYKALLRLIKGHKLAVAKKNGYNLSVIAKTLDVDRKTLKKWLGTSTVRKALQEEVEYYLSKMMETGNEDWRQWKAQVDLALESKEDRGNSPNNVNIMIVSNPNEFRISMTE